MKKTIVIHFIALILIASSCEKVDLSEVNNRLDKLENPVFEIKPKLNSITFLAKDNVESLIGDVQGEVVGDSIVECWCHHFMKDKYLVPQIVWSGQTITIDGSPYEEENAYDFKKPVVITIGNGDEEKLYKVYVHAFTGLPIMEIDTDGRVDITSKEEYQHASLVLKEDVITRAPGDIFQAGVNIKGRGNATWTLYPKKPYRLKFDQKVALLGEKEDKSWVLLANYADKTMMRTQIASFIGKMSLLEYTPSFHFVELILNGKYLGTYQLGEKIKISKNRVNIGNDGFLLEMDGYAKQEDDARYFELNSLPQPINIKEPSVEYGDEKFNYIKDFLTEVERALYSEDFKDKDIGWQKYLDITSFVDWYIICELTKTIDAFWWSSTYMNLIPGGKLKMGPIWDFDHSFGNYIHEGETENPEGFWVKELYWYKRLFEDPTFSNAVKDRYNYFYSKRFDVLNEINENAQYLRYSAVENNNKWGTLYTYIFNDLTIWGSYMNEVEYMKEWLIKRFDWLKANL